jgi:hypothetical protein
VAAEIPEAEDALAVGDDDDLDAPLGPVLEHLEDLAPDREGIGNAMDRGGRRRRERERETDRLLPA